MRAVAGERCNEVCLYSDRRNAVPRWMDRTCSANSLLEICCMRVVHCTPPVQAAFADIQARYSQAAVATAAAADADAPQPGKTATKWPRSQPEHSTATFAQLMLLHGAGWPNHLMWEHWQAAHPAGSLALFVHMKVTGDSVCQACDVLNRHSSSSGCDACAAVVWPS
jgi:hypothetical protein